MKLRKREERKKGLQPNYRTHFTNKTRDTKRSLHEWSLVDGEAEAHPSSAGGWSDREGRSPICYQDHKVEGQKSNLRVGSTQSAQRMPKRMLQR